MQQEPKDRSTKSLAEPAGKSQSLPDRERFERRARSKGYSLIAGVDEVGRSAWAGPMVAAAVILPENFDPQGIRSSKSKAMKRPGAREAAYERIMREATGVAMAEVSAADLDTKGFDKCHMDLLRQAVVALNPEPDYVLVDFYSVPGLRKPQESITGGDDLSVSIAAASIVAKITCDRIMGTFAQEYPGYGFADNRGYWSNEHVRGLDRLGPSPIHRRSISVIRRRLQTELDA